MSKSQPLIGMMVCAQGGLVDLVLQSVREGRWTHGVLLETSPSHEMEAVFFSLGGAPLVGESAVRPLFGLVVPSSAIGETWRASSQARNVLMDRENPRERRRARGGVKQVLIYSMIGRSS